MSDKDWEKYEAVAADLMKRFREQFGFADVEGKQKVPGASGTQWEIDAKGICEDGDGFVIVECKHYGKDYTVNQETVGGLAFRIEDTGAKRGLLVTTVGLQEGAEKVAASADIQTVTLSYDSTPEKYLMEFLNRVFVGVTDHVHVGISERVIIRVFDSEGSLIDSRELGELDKE